MKRSFEEEYRNRVNVVVEFIDSNLARELTLIELAEISGISRFHFHRLFTMYVGESLNSYVRRQRIMKGAYLIKARNSYLITEIARKVGYVSASSFIRAFRKLFGTTPTEILSGNHGGLKIGSAWRTIKAPLLLPQEIKVIEKMTILGWVEKGYSGRTFQRAATKVFNRVISAFQYAEVHHINFKSIGIANDDPDISDKNNIEYFGGLIVTPSIFKIDIKSLKQKDVESGQYAVFVHKGSYKYLWQTWNQAFRNWLPSSGFDLNDAPTFEIYVNDPRTVKNDEDLLTELYIPIKEIN